MTALEVINLTKHYLDPQGNVCPVLDVPFFSLEKGAQVGLRGVSGSGKTTFLHLIAGILIPNTGSIRLAGETMSGLGEAARDRLRAASLGYIFQTFNLLQGLSAEENVLLGMAFGPGPDRSRARALLDRVGLSDRKNHRPRELSSGQQQRVALARALANRPSLVLADEPTGNLDRRRAEEAITLLREVCREDGAALIVVSHDEQILARLDQVIDFAALNRAAAKEGAS